MSNVQETKVALTENQAATLAMWDEKIASTELFLAHSPDPRLSTGVREILQEYCDKRTKFLFDCEHPAPPPPVAPTPELISRIRAELETMMPEIVARVIVGLSKK